MTSGASIFAQRRFPQQLIVDSRSGSRLVQLLVIHQGFPVAVDSAANVTSQRFSRGRRRRRGLTENWIVVVPLHVLSQFLLIGKNICAQLALEVFGRQVSLWFVPGAMYLPQMRPQLANVVESVVAHLTLQTASLLLPLTRRLLLHHHRARTIWK